MVLSDMKVSWEEGENKRTGGEMDAKYAGVMNTKRCKGQEKDKLANIKRDVKDS